MHVPNLEMVIKRWALGALNGPRLKYLCNVESFACLLNFRYNFFSRSPNIPDCGYVPSLVHTLTILHAHLLKSTLVYHKLRWMPNVL